MAECNGPYNDPAAYGRRRPHKIKGTVLRQEKGERMDATLIKKREIPTRRYLIVPYAVKVVPTPRGGYSACVPELSERQYIAQGETPEVAVANLFGLCIKELNGLRRDKK